VQQACWCEITEQIVGLLEHATLRTWACHFSTTVGAADSKQKRLYPNEGPLCQLGQVNQPQPPTVRFLLVTESAGANADSLVLETREDEDSVARTVGSRCIFFYFSEQLIAELH
jgi:hypothetical protein